MASKGGPALGDTLLGSAADALGPGVALMLGGVLTIAYVGAFLGRDNPVRRYTGAAEPAAPPVESAAGDKPPDEPARGDANLDTGQIIGNTIAPT
ncbi:MAG TPA: hypothetical protein VF223_24120 [Trebonia sp.]